MGTDERATGSRSRTLRIINLALVAALGSSALAAYAGCSSSPAPEQNGDSGAPPATDSGTDATTLGPDGALPDSSSDDATQPSEDGATDAPAGDAAAPVNCADDDSGTGLPTDLACTGLYSDWATKTVTTGILPYTPGYLLWSDGANKTRYLYLPPGTQIDTSDMDNWVFPVGTKIWKQFSLGPQRIETRLFAKVSAGTGGWVWTTYRWSADGETSATLLDNGETNVNGTSYEIPSHGACLQCHGGRPDMVMGLEGITLGASTAVGVTLSTLIAQSAFTINPPASIEIPEDSSGNARASLGWLHINCGVPCHNSNSTALAQGTGLFLKTSVAQLIAGGGATTVPELTPYVTAVNVVPKMQPFASEGFLRIDPGHPTNSLVPTLDGARNNPNIPQMPPIVSHIVDTTDVANLNNWITTMPIPDAGAPDASDAGIADANAD
ncbi:MAG: hypothetical protein ACLQVI_28645 [Polyangiaceae bacterium]